MRTFEEACRATIIREERGPGADENRMLAEIQEALDRRGGVLRQVQESPEAAMLVLVLHGMNQGGVSVSDLIRIAFANGVIVGMEMERAEPPIPAESVPGRRERPSGYTGV